MNAADTLAQALNRYALPAHFGPGVETLDLDTDDGRLGLDLVTLDLLGCSFVRLVLASDRLAGATPAELGQLSEALCRRVRYLLEPLGPLEIDREACVVQMRSLPPLSDSSGHTYYELLVKRGGEISLARFRKDRGQVRQRVPASVTREVLLRLLGDFAAVLP